MKKDGSWPQPAVIRITEEETLRPFGLELFARVQLSKGIRQGWAVIGDQFLMDEEDDNPNDLPPWQVRWNSLKGTAKEKLAVLDPEMASKLGRGLTLHTAKRILLGRDCDAIAALRVQQLKLSTAPYLTLVPRLIGRRSLVGHLVLKCTCGAVWERMSYFGCANWYWVGCRSCKAVRHSFRMLPPTGDGNMQIDWFEFKPTLDRPSGFGCNAIPVRELEAA
jgi:hypothetical protein